MFSFYILIYVLNHYRLHDDVVEWVKKAQKAIGVAGDEILDGLGDSLSDGKSLKFIGNVDFYASISKEKIGHIQAVDFPKPQDFVLDLVTLIPEIVLYSSIKCANWGGIYAWIYSIDRGRSIT